MTYAPFFPHDDVEEIGQDVFMVRGSFKPNSIVRFSRNMAIVRFEKELTLINPIRVNERVEEQIKSLGKIKNIMRTGGFHGLDDPYYVGKHGAKMFAQPGHTHYKEPRPDIILNSSVDLPFPNAQLFCFENLNQPESAVLLENNGGLLLTCDSIQHWADRSHCNLPARILLPLIGFSKTTLIGPAWLKVMVPKEIDLLPQFQKLLEWQFERLLGAHGTLLEANAHNAATKAVEKTF